MRRQGYQEYTEIPGVHRDTRSTHTRLQSIDVRQSLTGMEGYVDMQEIVRIRNTTRSDLSTRHTYSDEPLSMHFVLSSYTQHAEWYDKYPLDK